MKRATENTEINVGTLGDDETLMEAVKGATNYDFEIVWRNVEA